MQLRSIVLVIVLGTTRAAAQPTTANAEADLLFEQGRSLMEAGKLAEACAAFEASTKTSPTVSTILNLANCREQNKQYASAYGWYREAERKTRVPGDVEVEKLNRVSRERAKALVDRLSKITIDVSVEHRAPGLQITRGGNVVDAGAWGRPLPVDGGTYEIVASAPDHESWKTTIEVGAEGDFKSVAVPKLVARPKPVTPVAARPARTPKWLPFAFGGAGLAFVGGAVGLDLWARSDYRKARNEPDDLAQEAQWSSAKSKRYAAQAVAGVGLASVGLAVWFYLRGRGDREHATRIEPVLGGRQAGLQLERRF